jgi:hypothetical protein
MKCTRCGAENAPGAAFCANCNAPLAPAAAPAYTPGYAPVPAPAVPGKGLAIASMVCGIVSFFCFGFC